MKKVFVIIFSIMLMVSLAGCKTTVNTVDTDDNYTDLFDKFVVIETRENAKEGCLYTVYDKDTMVEYYIVLDSYKGLMTPVYNTDGSIKVYSEN